MLDTFVLLECGMAVLLRTHAQLGTSAQATMPPLLRAFQENTRTSLDSHLARLVFLGSFAPEPSLRQIRTER